MRRLLRQPIVSAQVLEYALLMMGGFKKWRCADGAPLPAQSGKSLPELMIVLAILGIMVVMAGPGYRAMMTRAQARSAAVEIASTLRLARQLAMAKRERVLVRFDLSDRSITIRQGEAETVAEVYRYGEKGLTLEPPTAGDEIYFHSSGRASTATAITLYDLEGRRMTLTVSLTGRVVMS